MDINLTHFRNVLGKKNDGTVVFTRNGEGQVIGLEKANYGFKFFGHRRNMRVTTPQENEQMRRLFVQTIIASSNAGKPTLTASTLNQIKERLGIVQGANQQEDLIGRPLTRLEIKAVLDIVDNSREQIKIDNEIIQRLKLDVDGYMREEFEKQVNAARFLSGTDDLRSILAPNVLGFDRAEVAKCVKKNLALLKALTLDEMTWHYQGTHESLNVEYAFKVSLKRMMLEFGKGRMPLTRTRKFFANAPVLPRFQDHDNTAEDYFKDHHLMPEEDLQTILFDQIDQPTGKNKYTQQILFRAMGYIKNAFREDFQDCLKDNNYNSQSAQEAYDARTGGMRKRLAEYANDLRNIASISPANLSKFHIDLAVNLLELFRKLGLDPAQVGASAFRDVFMVALEKTASPFSMRRMAEKFADLQGGHQEFQNANFRSDFIDDFNRRVASLARDSGYKMSIATWQAQAFLAVRDGRAVPELDNNLKNDAIERQYVAFKREREESDPERLRERREARNRQAALRLIGEAANQYNEIDLQDAINSIYINFYKCAHGWESVLDKDGKNLPRNEVLPRANEWLATASDDEIAFLERFCKLGLDKLDENIQKSHLQALGSKTDKPPLYVAFRDSGPIFQGMNQEAALAIATILDLTLASRAKSGAKITDGYFLRMMGVKLNDKENTFANCKTFLDKLYQEAAKGSVKPYREFFSQEKYAELANHNHPLYVINDAIGKRDIFKVKGFGTLDPLKIIQLLKRAGISFADFSCENQEKRADTCVRLLALLHFASHNNYDLDGLPEYIQRVTGKSVTEVSVSDYFVFRRTLGKPDPVPKGFEPVVNIITGKLSLAEATSPNKDGKILLSENDIYNLRDAFAELQKANPKRVNVMIMKKTIVLEKLADGGVRATLMTDAKDRPEKQYRFAQNAVDFSRALDDVVVSNAREYKPGVVKSVLPPLPNSARGDSLMRARELYSKTICAFTGRSPVDYSTVPTEHLRQLAIDVVDRKQLPENIVVPPPQKFNSEEMIEMHRNLVHITMSEVNAKVTLPADATRRTVESRRNVAPNAKEFRSLVADLFLNDDTWGFDAQVAAVKGERLRKLMLANSHELHFVFNDIDGFVNHLPKDRIPVNQNAQDNQDAPVNEIHDGNEINEGDENAPDQPRISDKVKEILTALKDIPAASLNPDQQGNISPETMQRLAAIEDLIESLVKSYAAVMQAKVTKLFQVQNAGVAEKQLQYQTFAEISGISGLKPDTVEGQFTLSILNEYFLNSALIDKRAMLAAMLRNTDDASNDATQVAELLKGAGPLLQKMLQGLPPSSFGPETRTALKDMKSRLAPISADAVKAQLLELVNSSNGEIHSIEVKKVLGAATVGEALLCHVKTKDHPLTGVDCVIKVLRPNIQTAILREKAIFEDIIARKVPGMSESFKRRYEGILKEFDLTIEAENIRLGHAHYEHPSVNGKSVIEISSMELVENVSPATGTLVVKKADGVTYDNYIDDIHAEVDEALAAVSAHAVELNGRIVRPCSSVKELIATRRRLEYLKAFLGERRNHIIDFTTAWFENGIFGDGFMHGDLHAGNIMVSDKGATIIDFGNCIRMTSSEQMNVRDMFTKASLGFGEDAINSFKKLLSPAEKTKLENLLRQDAAFQKNLYGIFKKGTEMDVMARIYAAMNLLQRKGVDIPDSISHFFQSFSRLNDIYEAMADEMARIDEAIDTLVLGEEALPQFEEDAPQLVKGFRAFVGMISSDPYVEFDYRKFADVANGYMFNQGMPLIDEKGNPFGGSMKIGHIFTEQKDEVRDILEKDRDKAIKHVVPFIEWLCKLEIPGDLLKELRKGPAEVHSGSIHSTSKVKLTNAIEAIKNNDVTSQAYQDAVKEIVRTLPGVIGRFALQLGQVMDPMPRTTKKIFGLASVKETRDIPINAACANVVGNKLADSGLVVTQFLSLLRDFWSRREQLALAIRENIRFGGKYKNRREFAHETLVASNNTLPEGMRLTKAKMRVLMRQMEAFAWPFDGAWTETSVKGENDVVKRIDFTLPDNKQGLCLDALFENLNALKTALGLETLPTEIARLAVTYLSQIDPRAALAVKSLKEEYNSLLLRIELDYPDDQQILKAAVDAFRVAPDDEALFKAKPDMRKEFQEIDVEANRFDASLNAALKMLSGKA